MKNLEWNWLLILLVLVIFLSRLSIFNSDAAQFWADEGRYPLLINNLNEAYKSGNYLLPIQNLFNIDARPGAGLFYYPAAFLEWISPGTPFSLYYNIIVNTLTLILVFFIIKKVLNQNTAVIATILLTFSIASFIYIRHTLPYDIALMLLLLGLFLHVYFKKTFVFGLLTGFSFITYPSYYYYIIPIPLLLISLHRLMKPALYFIGGILVTLISTQLFSILIDGASYFRSLQDQSGGVTAIRQGDYISALSFISEYIIGADGYWYLFLSLVFIPGIFLVKDKRKMIFFAAYLVSVFFILELFSHILQMHVLYGRTVRPLYLLSLGFSAVVMERIFNNFKNRKLYILCLSVLLLVSIINWLPRFLAYKDLIYPKQFRQEARDYLNLKNDKYEIEDALFVNYWDTDTSDPKLVWHFFKPGESGKYYTMNAIQTFPYFGNFNLDEFCKNEVLIKKPHIQYIFKPSQFEGYTKAMREKMEKDPFYYQLILCR